MSQISPELSALDCNRNFIAHIDRQNRLDFHAKNGGRSVGEADAFACRSGHALPRYCAAAQISPASSTFLSTPRRAIFSSARPMISVLSTVRGASQRASGSSGLSRL